MQSMGDNRTRAMFSGMKQGIDVDTGKRRCMGCMKQYDINSAFCPHCGYPAVAGVEKSLHLYPGTVLQDRYVIGRVIGSGGFGTTYLAWDHVLQRERAIKEYLPSDLSTRSAGQSCVTVFSGDKTRQFAEGLVKFVDEAKKLAKFNNESGIVKVYDSFEENNTAYIVMEFLDGETLAQFLARVGPLHPQQAINILLPVMDSLKKVHSQGIIHRDIAPDNIFLTKDGQVKLIDFGAARIETTSRSRSLTVIIKPGYSAEEQYRSRGEQGAHTDVYSLGATLYKMITGVTPPDALERRANYEKNRKDVLVPITKFTKEITPNQETAIYNAMNVRIEDRTEDALLFARELTTAEKVKRRKGTIKKIDLYRWPLWAKIAVPAALALIITFGALFGFGVIGSADFNLPDGQTRVPDVVAQDIADAEIKINRKGLKTVIINKIESDKIAKNMVVYQDPEAGSIVDEGTVVNITISAGKGVDVVPEVVNYNGNRAQQILEKAGYKVTVKEEKNSSAAPGSVIRQSIKAGTELEKGTEIILTVSAGGSGINSGKPLEVPSVTGMTFDEAKQYLAQHNVYIAINETVYDSNYSSNQIVKQTPPAGQKIYTGDTISVTVNAATQVIYTPDVVYRTTVVAEQMLEEKGFTVRIKYVNNSSQSEGTVIGQNINAGTKVPVGTEITIAVCKKQKATVPDVVNQYYETALKEITDRGINCKAYFKSSSTVEKNRIISQSLAPGTVVDAGVTMKVYISSGNQTTQTTSAPLLPRPSTKAEIVQFYNQAVNQVKTGAASVDRNYSKVNTNGSIRVPSAVFSAAESLGGTEAIIKDNLNKNSLGLTTYTGSQIKANFPVEGESYSSRLTTKDVSSASCTESGGIYTIKLTTYADSKSTSVYNSSAHNPKAFNVVTPDEVNSNVPSSLAGMLGNASIEYPASTVTITVNARTGKLIEALYELKWTIYFDDAGVTLPFVTRTSYRVKW